jgi:glyoxylase-like metal-dependent hydrolase (beta-lactamase superfamily II)
MRILGIKGSNNVYTCNVYLVMGDWKKIEDVNTLIDVGNDPTIIEVLKNMNAGVGKNKVEQVILTHSHSDHTAILPLIRKAFDPVVCAFSPFMSGVDRVLHDGETLLVGDREFEVIHAPGHSEDSITLYNEDEGALFVGDASLIIRSTGGTYEEGFVRTLKRLCQKNIQTMYFGHGDPLTRDVDQALRTTLKMVRAGLPEKSRDTHGKEDSERRT